MGEVPFEAFLKGELMSFGSLLIANRGEIAIRVARTATELGIRTVGVYSRDDALSLHRAKVDVAVELPGEGPAAYLNIDALLEVAAEQGVDGIHPGYGFLAENAEFARRCASAGIQFVGPSPAILELCGDKAAARERAQDAGLAVMPGTAAGVTLGEARDFMRSLGEGAPRHSRRRFFRFGQLRWLCRWRNHHAHRHRLGPRIHPRRAARYHSEVEAIDELVEPRPEVVVSEFAPKPNTPPDSYEIRTRCDVAEDADPSTSTGANRLSVFVSTAIATISIWSSSPSTRPARRSTISTRKMSLRSCPPRPST